MSAQRVLLDVLNRGVQVGVDDGDLSVRALNGALTQDLRDALKAAKADVAAFIGGGRRLARMSFAQRRMWFIDRLTPGSALYAATAASYRLQGPLDAAALETAINGVVQRHEVLRTTFPFVNGEPVQSIHAFSHVALPLIDFSQAPEADCEAEALAKAAELVREPFDLARGPLFRPALIRITADDHILVLPMHHIINDGWSVGVLYRELRALYAGCGAELPALQAQYADVSEVQHRLAESEDGARQLAYWKDRLGGTLPVLNLAGDRARSTAPEFEGARARVMLPPELGAALKRAGREEGASLFMIGLAAYYALLHRYTGDQDIVVGSPIAGRTAEHSEDLLGLFVNTVALRAPVRADDSLRAVIRAVREAALGAFANQDVPFDKVVAEVQPDRDLTHSPLFRVMFVLQNAPAPAMDFGDAALTPLELHTDTAKFDFSLELVECEHGIRTTLEYNTALFGEAFAHVFLGHYRRVLEAIAEDVEQRVATVDILSEAERKRLLVEFNDTRVDFEDARPVHVRFAEWAARRPDAPAVLWESGSISYGALERAANALAHRLMDAGIGLGDIVAVCAPRSPEMITAQLAVLKTGAAYLSLDPEHPFERLKHVVLDAGARALLMQPEHTGHFPNIPAFPIDLRAAPDAATVTVESRPDDLAYVIYTSGSTGKPKGVAVPHGGLSNLAAWHQAAFGVTESDRGSQLASPAFDASVWEIWPYLSAGAAVSMCPETVRTEPTAFRDWLLSERITVGFAPTDLIEPLFALEWPGETPLRHLLTGGALLTERPPAGLPFTVVNNYGPTENSVVTTSGVVEPGNAPDLPSIGRAIANHDVFILDDALRLAPLGVPGELYIGGAGLAREYLHDAERTARQFVMGPVDAPNPERLYKTGDRGRFLPDGSIQFLGRRDHQVNVRGYRIELAEIEAAAQLHEDVAEAVAMPLAESAGGAGREFGLRLFVTPRADAALTGGASESHVKQWQTLYDDTYGDAPINMDPALNVIGWNSSYTGAPIPVHEMREWRDCTVARLRAFRPRRVLEIGCGTGMILAELAPHCERYTAVDFSAEALQYVRKSIVERRGLCNVELIHAAADALDALAGRSFDLVVLNSVVQYFPSAPYLESVLTNALRLTEPGGAVFVGDVRNHALLYPFHAMIQAHASNLEDRAETVVQRVRRNALCEEELVIDPAYFAGLARDNAAIGGVQTLIKRGRADNELSQFRYDAVLFAGTVETANPAVVDWSADGLWESNVLRAMETGAVDVLRVAGIPNGRIATAHRVWESMARGSADDTFKALLDAASSNAGIHPEDVLTTFRGRGYALELHCNPDRPECFDVVLTRNGVDAIVVHGADAGARSDALTNAPLEAGRLRGLGASVREHLQRLLPAYMEPNRVVALASFPRTASGKVDRQALCALDDAVPTGAQYVAPRNELEEAVVAMWTELLGIEQVGVDDNFFELGGHSLLATQLVAQLNEAYGVDLPLRELFVRPTPAGVAAAVEEALMREIEDLTEDEAARLVAS